MKKDADTPPAAVEAGAAATVTPSTAETLNELFRHTVEVRNQALGALSEGRERVRRAQVAHDELQNADSEAELAAARQSLPALIASAEKAKADYERINAQKIAASKKPAAPLTPPTLPPPGLIEYTREQAVRLWQKALGSRVSMLSPDEKMTSIIAYALGGPKVYASPETKAEYDAFVRADDRDCAIRDAHGWTEARKAWEAHQEKIQTAIEAGTVSEHEGWTQKDFEEDFAMKCEAAKESRRRRYKLLLPFAQKRSQLLIHDIKARADEMEANDRELHAEYGVAYGGPSNLITQIRRAAAFLETRLRETPNGAASPRQLMPWLDDAD